MDYLQSPENYADQYDLFTIELCLDRLKILDEVIAELKQKKEFEELSDDERERNINYFRNMELLNIELSRYKHRTERIEESIEKDRKRQDLQDNTPPPTGIKCSKCKGEMNDTLHHLHTESDKPDRVIFFFECKKCNLRKAIYDDGEEWIYKPEICKKCGTDLKSKFVTKGNFETWTTSCTKCDYKKVDKTNIKKEKAEREAKEKKDTELLTQYRDEFCLKQDKAEEYINAFDEMAFASKFYEYEVERLSGEDYEKTNDVKKLNIGELENLLLPILEKEKFIKLNLKEPSFGKFVEIDFTTQDLNLTRNKNDSCSGLTKVLKEALEPTNWRLMSEGITYRLRYLVGRLRGYEQVEDILKLFAPKKPKQQKQLDPKLLEKYRLSNAVGLARISAEYEATKRIRMKRLKNEPDGFLLRDSEGGYYSCNLCRKSIRGSETWWIPEGIICLDCQRNIKNKVISKEVLSNDKISFSTWDLEQEFGLHSATIRKFVRNGELVARKLLNEEGKEYYNIFMAEDNVEFFKTHERVRERKKRWHFVDQKTGEIVWL